MAITTVEYLGLQGAGRKFELPLTSRVSGNQGSLFGGAGLAAGVAALEAATDQPVIWATGQYLARTEQPATLELSVELPAIGRSVTQGRVIGHIGDREIITVIGATGTRPETATGCWPTLPIVDDPDDCDIVERGFDVANVHDHVDVRMANGMFGFNGTGDLSGDNETLLWARMPEVTLDAAGLALLGDYMASALGNALGRMMFCTSLDNTIRMATRLPIDDSDGWVLCHNRMEFVGSGFAHGSCHMWSRSGQLLATASQSMVVFEAP